jgi:PqqD family protein of HPr-rel-A system
MLYWQALPLTTIKWDHEYVVYNNASGDTHILDERLFKLLEYCKGKPCFSIDSLASFISNSDERHEELEVNLKEVIKILEKKELIEPIAL